MFSSINKIISLKLLVFARLKSYIKFNNKKYYFLTIKIIFFRLHNELLAISSIKD